MEPKYYFVCYEREIYTQKTPKISMKCQIIIDKHPLQFQIDCNKERGDWSMRQRDDVMSGVMKRENYTIISWQPLTLEEYKQFDGHIG